MPNQKYFDIIPPGRYPTEEAGETDIPKKLKEKLPSEQIPKKVLEFKRRFQIPRFPIKKSFLFLFFILIFLGILSYSFFQRAGIFIWPETESANWKTQFTVSAGIEKIDPLHRAIPGEILSFEKIISQEFPASGKGIKEAKAEGTIRVYNAYSASSQALIANTRFVSAEGRLFRSVERVVIPGRKQVGGKLEPGFLDITVVAAEAGPEYNIGPSTFSIPGFAGTPKFTAFYGKSFESMKGGVRGEVSQVTREDLDKAASILKEATGRETENILKNKISKEFILVEGAFQKEENSPIFSEKAGDTADSFTGDIRITLKAFVFKQQDLTEVSREFSVSQIPQEKKLKEESMKIKYDKREIEFNLSQITLHMDLSAILYSKIDSDFLKKEISGKPRKEAENILRGKPQIV